MRPVRPVRPVRPMINSVMLEVNISLILVKKGSRAHEKARPCFLISGFYLILWKAAFTLGPASPSPGSFQLLTAAFSRFDGDKRSGEMRRQHKNVKTFGKKCSWIERRKKFKFFIKSCAFADDSLFDSLERFGHFISPSTRALPWFW